MLSEASHRVTTALSRVLPPWVNSFWRFLRALWDQIQLDQLLIRASGLAYASLLATVPLVAVLFALFSAFAAFDDLKQRAEEFLFSQFLPTRQDEIVTYVNQFTENVGKLGFVGFVFLIVTAILLLDSIESNFNDIWHIRSRRRLLAKITAYTSVLVFGTVFIGASLSISAQIKAELFTGSILDRSFINVLIDWSVPLLLTLLGFFLMYLIIPFARVKVRSAVLGALVAGVLWELAKNVFALSVGQSVRYSTIYGSLATIPIFLVWLYVTWIIVLLGLEVVFTHQHLRALERNRSLARANQQDRVSVALEFFAYAGQRFHRGDPPPSVDELAERFSVTTAEAEAGVDRLIQAGLLRTASAGAVGEGLVPATSLQRVRVADVVAACLGTPQGPREDDSALARAVADLVMQFRAAGEDAVGAANFQQIIEGLPDEAEAS